MVAKHALIGTMMLVAAGCTAAHHSNPDRMDAPAPSNTLETSAYNYLLSTPAALEHYKACIMLGELPPDPAILGDARQRLNAPHTTDTDARLCLQYLLAKKSGRPEDMQRFVMEYPTGAAYSHLLELHAHSGYLLGMMPPMTDLLVQHILLTGDMTALQKLLAGLPYADGAHAESLTDALAHVYRRYPARVEHAFDVAKIPGNTRTLIVQKSQLR